MAREYQALVRFGVNWYEVAVVVNCVTAATTSNCLICDMPAGYPIWLMLTSVRRADTQERVARMQAKWRAICYVVEQLFLQNKPICTVCYDVNLVDVVKEQEDIRLIPNKRELVPW